MTKWVVGVDLGATKIAMGLIAPDNQIVAYRRLPTGSHEGPDAVVHRLARSMDELAGEMPQGAQIEALGICSPGPVNHETGFILDPPNMPGLHHSPLGSLLADRVKIPVRLEHDAKAAALGEFHYGAGRGARSLVYIVVGTGVGAAIIADGKLYRGVNNAAGEIGHTTLDREGARCSCGSRGCVETFLSGPWLARNYCAAIEHAAAVRPGDSEPVTGEMVACYAEEGDSVAIKVMQDAGETLGIAVSMLAMVLDIDLYVIGGSVARCGGLLLEPARAIVPRYSHQSVGSRVRIVSTDLHEDGPILGCGWLARQAL